MAATKTLFLDKIRIDGDTQPRVAIDEAVVAEYAEHYKAGTDLPPVLVYNDGTDHWLADGFHRYHASRKAGLKSIVVEVVPGTKQEAQWAACAANKGHGLRRTNADKRKAVEMALAAKPDASDRVLAEHVGVSGPTVAEVRRQVQKFCTSTPPPPTRTGKDGKAYPAPPTRPAPPSKPVPKPIGTASSPVVHVPQATAPSGPPPARPRPGADAKATEAIEQASRFDELANRVHALKRDLAALAAEPIGHQLRAQQIDIDLRNVAAAVKFGTPHTACPHLPCTATCKLCKGQHWITAEQVKLLPKGGGK